MESPKYKELLEKLPVISEETAKSFSPALNIGISIRDIYLKLERRNELDILDIDYHILKNGEPIAYIDNEQRLDDYIFRELYT